MPSADPFSFKRFMLKTALPIVSAAVAAALLVCGVLYWSSIRADEISFSRQENLVRLVMSQLREQIAHDQESSTVWDDAVTNVREERLDWIEANLGSWMHTYFGHDGAIILGASDQPLFASISGQIASAADTYAAISTQAASLVAGLRSAMRNWDGASPSNRTLSPGAADLAIINDRPAVISVKPIISDTGEIEQVAGTENLHVAFRYLDDSFLHDLRENYLFEGVRFSWTLNTNEGEAAVPLKSISGKSVGYLIWNPYRPGSAVMSFMAPVLGLLFFVTAAVLAILIHRLYKRSMTLRQREAEVEHLALRDTLTGLSNRLAFNNGLDQLLQIRSRTAATIAVLYLDLDRFKHVNDTLGHPTGDDLIRQFAARLAKITRGGDVVGRIGGDEFTVALADVDDHLVEDICRRIIDAVKAPFDIDGNHINVGVSIGVALAPLHGSMRTDLLRKADIALYHAKSAGRGRFAIFGQDMDAHVQERRSTEHDLRLALEKEDEITVLFQPLFSAGSGQITGVEALARWKHPVKGWIAPSVFIPVAEDSGLIEKLGERVLDLACQAALRWGSIKVAVNVSVVELRNPLYCMKVANIIMATGISPRQLELEVTESTLADENGTCEANIKALRELGVRIALDDFGTGFSSLSRLRMLSVDTIKVDRSFVKGLNGTGSDAAIVRAIIDLAKATGLKTTAEGVETAEQEKFLQLAGCDELQGFLMSKPVPEAQISSLLQKGHLSRSDRRSG